MPDEQKPIQHLTDKELGEAVRKQTAHTRELLAQGKFRRATADLKKTQSKKLNKIIKY
jgi:hypothetical protein